MRTHQPQTDTAERTHTSAQRATKTATLENRSPQAAQLQVTQDVLQRKPLMKLKKGASNYVAQLGKKRKREYEFREGEKTKHFKKHGNGQRDSKGRLIDKDLNGFYSDESDYEEGANEIIRRADKKKYAKRIRVKRSKRSGKTKYYYRKRKHFVSRKGSEIKTLFKPRRREKYFDDESGDEMYF